MTNPIPHSGLWATPTLEDLQLEIESLPAKQKALVYNYVMMALNAAHALVEEQLKETV
jgi:hypothetical protein